jgi:hypothetical protein
MIVVDASPGSLGVVVAVHHALGGSAYDGATYGADSCAERAAGQADHTASHSARGSRAAGGRMVFTVADGAAVDFAIQLRIVVSVHDVLLSDLGLRARNMRMGACTPRAAAYRLHLSRR